MKQKAFYKIFPFFRSLSNRKRKRGMPEFIIYRKVIFTHIVYCICINFIFVMSVSIESLDKVCWIDYWATLRSCWLGEIENNYVIWKMLL